MSPAVGSVVVKDPAREPTFAAPLTVLPEKLMSVGLWALAKPAKEMKPQKEAK